MGKGSGGFDAYFSGIYGDRWPGLRDALLAEPVYAELGAPLVTPYFLDSASVAAAEALPLEDGNRVLDMCAAPGGKSLVLACAMGPSGTLTANELSGDRRERMRRVFSGHLPPDILGRVSVTGFDASTWLLHEREAFDRILVDAPCSSERHLLSSPAHLNTWTPARSKHLSIRQFALLASALEVVTPGGFLVYSTCSISPPENDAVIERLLKKRPDRVDILFPGNAGGERTGYGTLMLPDRCGGAGPIYFSVLRRIC